MLEAIFCMPAPLVFQGPNLKNLLIVDMLFNFTNLVRQSFLSGPQTEEFANCKHIIYL